MKIHHKPLLFISIATAIFLPFLIFTFSATPSTSLASGPQATPLPTPIPLTAEDLYLPGTQPNTLTTDFFPASECRWCHSNYGAEHMDAEPFFNWQGSMMSQSARDPVFWAAVAIANQDVVGAGTFCLRCHAPNAWLNGRSAPDGSQLTSDDYDGIQCHFCHRMVDHTNVTGVGIPRDADIIAALPDVPPVFGAGMNVIDPEDERRGPWNLQDEGWYIPDCTPQPDCGDGNPHRDQGLSWPWQSDFHKASENCGVCHDLLNPVYSGDQTNGFAVDPVGQANPNPESGFPEQRTYTEWLLSEYATEAGVYAPQFNPALPDGIIHSCQDCHMASVADESAAQDRSRGYPCRLADGVTSCPTMVTHDLVPVHDLTGANTWVLNTLKLHPVFSDTVDVDALDAGIIRAEAMLQKAATITATVEGNTLFVRVINETGHKLPTGYPEGRQMWLEVTGYDMAGNVVYHSGAYDEATGTLIQDADLAWFGTWQGLSEDWAAALGVDPTTYHFHLALNNEVQFDNRIPPRGFNNAAFLASSIAPVGATYADGQYWADVQYTLPDDIFTVTIALHYQLASRSYIEFLRDTNYTNDAGNILYDLWTLTNMSPPVNMVTEVIMIGYQIFLPLSHQQNP